MSSGARKEIDQKLNLDDISLVRFLYVDLCGLVRGKITPVAKFSRKVEEGIGLVKGMMAMNILDQMQTDTGLGATGEVRMVPDLDTFSVLPYAEGSAQVITDLVQLDKADWEFCPRSLLKRVSKEAFDLGFVIQAAFEQEYMLGNYSGDLPEYEPLDSDVCFGTEAMNRANDFYSDLYDCLSKQNIEVEQFYPEAAHGQHELSVKYAPSVQACDRYIIVKETLKGLAERHKLLFTQAPKAFDTQVGNGCHLHLSIWDKDLKNNLTYEDNPESLSTVAKQFIAGLLSHMPALVSLTCPSVNSYRRLEPKCWSSAYTSWGLDNREAAIRVPSLYWDSEKESCNLEIKCVDNTINPYLAMAAIIACGLDGIRKELMPPEPVEGDPSELSEEEAKQKGVVRLPKSLNSALIELETDIYLKKVLGERLFNSYITLKTSEVNAFSLDDDFEFAQHRLRY